MIILVPPMLVFVVEVYIVKVLYSAVGTRSAIGGDIELLLVQAMGTASVFCILSAYKKRADNIRVSEKYGFMTGNAGTASNTQMR